MQNESINFMKQIISFTLFLLIVRTSKYLDKLFLIQSMKPEDFKDKKID